MKRSDFENLAQLFRTKLLPVTRKYLRSDDDADDVVQDTLLRMWMMRSKIEAEKAESLAFSIARNLCITNLRMHQRHKTDIGEPFHSVSSDDPFADLVNCENEAWLSEQMANLPSGQMIIMRMKQGDDMSISDIARTLGMREDAVRQQLSKARRKLLNQLKERN